MGTFNGQDLVELIRGKKEEVPEKPSGPVEKIESEISKVKYGPKSLVSFKNHNVNRMEKGLPALTLKEFQELTGEAQ